MFKTPVQTSQTLTAREVSIASPEDSTLVCEERDDLKRIEKDINEKRMSTEPAQDARAARSIGSQLSLSAETERVVMSTVVARAPDARAHLNPDKRGARCQFGSTRSTR